MDQVNLYKFIHCTFFAPSHYSNPLPIHDQVEMGDSSTARQFWWEGCGISISDVINSEVVVDMLEKNDIYSA